MREVFFRIFLLMAFFGLIIAPPTSDARSRWNIWRGLRKAKDIHPTFITGSRFTVARDEIIKEISDMKLRKINAFFNYPHFLKNDNFARVEKTVRSSVGCENAINSLQCLVRGYKSPEDIEEDILKAKAKDAYDKCIILMSNLNELEVGKQITESNEKTLTSNLQFGLDYLKGISPMNHTGKLIHERSSDLLADLNKLEVGKKFTEEKKESLKRHIQFVLDNLKDTDFDNGEEKREDLAIVVKIMELKTLSSSPNPNDEKQP